MKKILYLLALSSVISFGQDTVKIDSLRSVLQTSNIQDSAKISLKLSHLYRRTKKDSSRYYADIAIKKALILKNDSLLAAAYFQRAFPEYYGYNHGEVLKYYGKIDSLSENSEKLSQIIIETKLYRSEISKFTFTMEGVLKARTYIQEGIKLAESQQDSFYINKMKYRLGAWHGFIAQEVAPKEHRDTAKTLLNEVIPYFQKTGNKDLEADVYNSLWGIYSNMGNDDKAEYYLTKRLETIKQTGDSIKLGQAYYYNGAYYRTREKPVMALKYLDSATHVYDIVGYVNNTVKKDVLKDEAYALEQLGSWKAAFLKLQKAFVLKDDIFKEQNVQSGIEMEAKYQAEKRDKEIALLTTQNNLAEEQKANLRNLFIAGISFTTLAALFFFFQYRNRQKTNKKLRELDTAKTTFFTNISHDFRTPLTLIKGPIEDQLEDTSLSISKRKNLNAAYRNTERLENLVGQLMSLAKLNSSTMTLQIQPVDLERQLQLYTEGFQYQSDELGLNFTLNNTIDNNIHWLDLDILEKVFYNLLGNALKYTNEGGVIEVTTTTKNGWFTLSVYNSCQILSIKEKELLFTRFYQTNPANPGTGIGLSLVKQLVQLHKGNISAENKEDGIVFIAKIPTEKSAYHSHEILNEVLHSLPNNLETYVEENSTNYIEPEDDAPILLIVDDTKDIREYVASIFQEAFKILLASDGKEALALAQKHIPDIIISDVMMPVMDGYALTKYIKNNAITSHIPILLLTAKSKETDQLEAIGLGADGYITKPFSSKILKASVTNLLENRRKLQQRFAQDLILTPKEIAVTTADEEFLNRLQEILEKHLTETDFTAAKFSEVMLMTRMQLHRKIKALTGLSSSEFIKNQRLKMGAKLIKTKVLNVSEVAYSIGFNDPSYFTRCFKQEYGVSPREFALKNK